MQPAEQVSAMVLMECQGDRLNYSQIEPLFRSECVKRDMSVCLQVRLDCVPFMFRNYFSEREKGSSMSTHNRGIRCSLRISRKRLDR